MSDPNLSAPGSSGYHADVEVYEDGDVKRNRIARRIVVIGGTIFILTGGWLVSGLLGLLLFGAGPVTELLSMIGFGLAGLYVAWLVPTRGLITVPESQGYITQDPLEQYYVGPLAWLAPPRSRRRDDVATGSMVQYGPTIDATYFWESRDEEGNHSTQNVTQKFVESLPTQTSAVDATVMLQYQPSLPGLRKFHLNDPSTIERGIEGYVRTYLSTKLASWTAQQAKDELATLNDELATQFRGSDVVTHFEEGYGIHITALTIEGIDYPIAVQEAQNARDEATRMREIVGEYTGLPENELTRMSRDNPRRYDELLDRALVQSGNASMEVRVLHGSANAALTAAVDNMVRGGSSGGATVRPQRRKRRSDK